MFDWEAYLPFVVNAVLITSCLRLLVARARCWTGFSLMKLRARAYWGPTRWARLLVLLGLVALSMVFARQAPLSGILGLTAAILAVVSMLWPGLELREHGLRFESAFVFWNSISRYSWADLRSGNKVLSLEGAWLFPKRLRVTHDQSSVLDSLISGASRFEPSTPLRRFMLATTSLLVWGAVLVLLVLFLKWLEEQYGASLPALWQVAS